SITAWAADATSMLPRGGSTGCRSGELWLASSRRRTRLARAPVGGWRARSEDGGVRRRRILRGQDERRVEGLLRSTAVDTRGIGRVRRAGSALPNSDHRVVLRFVHHI